MTDQEELWRRIRAGDRQVFEAFYRAYAGRILQFLCRMTGNRQASEDITQEVFIGLWKHSNGFDPGRGDVIRYIFGIARNRGAEWWSSCPMESKAPLTAARCSSKKQVSNTAFSRDRPSQVENSRGRSGCNATHLSNLPRISIRPR